MQASAGVLRKPEDAAWCADRTGMTPILMGHLLLIARTAASATLHRQGVQP